MKDILNKFDIFMNTSNISQALCDFKNDTQAITLTTSDYLYVGYQARFNALYFYANTLNTNSSSLTLEYFHSNTGWTELSDVFDDTLGFSRNGFIEWKPEEYWTDNNEVNSLKRFWVRVSTSVNTSAMVVNAVNVLFSNDDELAKVYYPISTNSSFKLGATNFMLIHEDVRDMIVQKFRNKGLRKLNSAQDRWLRVTPLDILDIQEVRLAATYYALSRIFFNVSDNPEDSWAIKSKVMEKKADEYLSLAFVSFDSWGEGDVNANPVFNVGRMWQ